MHAKRNNILLVLQKPGTFNNKKVVKRKILSESSERLVTPSEITKLMEKSKETY